jgi:hypothetical protein
MGPKPMTTTGAKTLDDTQRTRQRSVCITTTAIFPSRSHLVTDLTLKLHPSGSGVATRRSYPTRR